MPPCAAQRGLNMGNYVIVTDSTTDLPADLLKTSQIEVIPMLFNLDGREYRNYPDGREIGFGAFYDRLRAGSQAGTVQLNISELTDIFERYLKRGLDLLYIAFSSALSGTCNSAMLAAEELSHKYPDRKILVVDSLSASMGEGLLVYLAAEQKRGGADIDQVYRFVCDNRLKLCHWFTVDDLNHLKRGGRLTATAALLGTVLGIKPVLHVDDNGRLVPVGKIRGRRQSIEQLVDKMDQTAIDPEHQTIFISHGDCADDARYLEELVRRKFGIGRIVTNFIGPVIGAHSGPGTLALFFLGKSR